MRTNSDVAGISNYWEQPALPRWWTNDLGVARSSLQDLLRDRGIEDSERVEKALRRAEDGHDGQARKGTDAPYAVHPIRLASLLIESFNVRDGDLLSAALLHDILEDTQTSRE